MLRVIDSLPGWLPTNNHLLDVGKAAKHHLADPTILGALFESLVVLNVRVFAQANNFDASHMRTDRGRHEVDLILQAKNGDLLAFGVKLSPVVRDKDVEHLLWLKTKTGVKLKEMVVVTTGGNAYRRSDGVAVIPLALLGQ